MTEEVRAERWSFAKLAAFRFVFVYFALYLPALPFDRLAGGDVLERALDAPLAVAAPWFSTHVLHLGLAFEDMGSPRVDAAYGYARVAFLLVVSGVAAVLWSVADRRRASYATLHEWFRVALRYGLANAMAFYGVSKVLRLQFGYPSLDDLVRPLGQLTPRGLLWNFMGYSAAYNVFTGGAEVVGGALLLFRRTTTLGALLLVAVLSNVVLLNLCYDVPIKLYAIHLLVIACVLVAPDADRLVRLLVLHRPTTPASFTPHAKSPAARRALAAVKGAYVLFLVHSVLSADLARRRESSDASPRSPLWGIYEVERFLRGGEDVPPLLTDASRWRTVTISGGREAPAVDVFAMDGHLVPFDAVDDAPHATLDLVSRTREEQKLSFRYHLTESGLFTLSGALAGADVSMTLRRVEPTELPLERQRFRWVHEHILR